MSIHVRHHHPTRAVENIVVQSVDACELRGCCTNARNRFSVLSNTSLMSTACSASHSPENWMISQKKKVTDIPDDLNASRSFLYLSQLLYDSEAGHDSASTLCTRAAVHMLHIWNLRFIHTVDQRALIFFWLRTMSGSLHNISWARGSWRPKCCGLRLYFPRLVCLSQTVYSNFVT